MPLISRLCAINLSPRGPRGQLLPRSSYLLLETETCLHLGDKDQGPGPGIETQESPCSLSRKFPLHLALGLRLHQQPGGKTQPALGGLGSDLLGRKIGNKTVVGRYEKINFQTLYMMVTS